MSVARILVLTCKLEVALEREVEGDLFLHDIGHGFGFRPGSFDGAIRYDLKITTSLKDLISGLWRTASQCYNGC